MNPRGPFLSRPWLVTGVSIVSIGVLSLLLASPWDRKKWDGGQALRVYCAAGMTLPIGEILQEYEQSYGVKAEVDYAGSGVLLAKIRARGGAGDLYLSADAAHMHAARNSGLVAEVIPIAMLRPVLIVQSKTWKELEKKGVKLRSLKDVLESDLKFVLANPEQASIGQMTKEVLERSGLWEMVQERLRSRSARASTVDTVNQVVQMVRTSEGYAGLAWSANAEPLADLHIEWLPELASAREPLQAGVLSKSRDPTAALRLARYLAAPDRGGKILKKHHYDLIDDADTWEETPTVHLSAGAMLHPGIDEVIKAFEKREGADFKTSYAGCGLLVGQMKTTKAGKNSSHFPDAYFACDQAFLDDVQDWFETGIFISQNPLVLVTPKGNPKGIRDLTDLGRADLRVGLAHPENSALGKLTDRLLKRLTLYDKVHAAERSQPIVFTDAAHLLINQMRVGALDVAVVYKSNVLSAESGKDSLEVIALNLPDAVARQPFAISLESRHKYLMRRLLQAIVAPDNAARFRSLGFSWMHEAK
ncbi:MAG: molybdate ABC transporter substrate-binding protein [Planctomycetes bacterium]|nr:molybdate ABC transporter substrate-binding protein [Planctomycetota bacterium]